MTETVLVEDTEKVIEAEVDGDTVNGDGVPVKHPTKLPLDLTVTVDEVVGLTEFDNDKVTVGEFEGIL